MEYSIKKLSEIAGVSTRTLRYYDEIGLLKPARVSSSGYRIYGKKQVDILQQILFYKELGMSLDEIKEIIQNPNFDRINALKEHKIKLLEKRKQIDMLLDNVERTLLSVDLSGLRVVFTSMEPVITAVSKPYFFLIYVLTLS